MAWTNEDGLIVQFGTERSTVIKNGLTRANVHKTLVHKFDYNDVATTDTAAVGPNDAFIPSGSVITRATLYVGTAWTSGGAATLDIGLKVAAGTNTDDDGIDSAIAITAMDAAGDTIVCDGAYIADGDLTALRLTADQYIMTTWDTAAYTAGDATLVVEYLEIEDN